jgi:NADPH-dependent F420 reductase
MAKEIVAILGGTGEQGLGLAFRFALARRPVRIGSRKQERARDAAEQVRSRVPEADVTGLENLEAARAAQGGIVILSVPFENVAATLRGIRDVLTPETVLVSMAVPLASAIGDAVSRVVGVSQGSCAELCASLVPEGVPVVSAFQNLPARRLLALDQPVECDVIVSGPKGARERVMALCEDLPGTRALQGGPLYNARYVEHLSALLIGLSRRHKLPDGAGLRITYI